MTLTSCAGVRDIPADPFEERRGAVSGVERQIMGGHFRFESGSEALLGLVDTAYARVPAHQLPVAETEFRIELRLVSRPAPPHNAEPPVVRLQSGAGLICSDPINGICDATRRRRAAPVDTLTYRPRLEMFRGVLRQGAEIPQARDPKTDCRTAVTL